MPLQLYKIASQELTTSTATVTFSNIPQGYTDLKVVVSARSNNADIQDYIKVRFNGDAADTNYSSRWVYGSGSATASGTNTFLRLGYINGATATANTFGNMEFYIPNYSATVAKSVSSDAVTENNATAAYAWFTAGLCTTTTAISSMTIFPIAGTAFLQYSTFTLYGIL